MPSTCSKSPAFPVASMCANIGQGRLEPPLGAHPGGRSAPRKRLGQQHRPFTTPARPRLYVWDSPRTPPACMHPASAAHPDKRPSSRLDCALWNVDNTPAGSRTGAHARCAYRRDPERLHPRRRARFHGKFREHGEEVSCRVAVGDACDGLRPTYLPRRLSSLTRASGRFCVRRLRIGRSRVPRRRRPLRRKHDDGRSRSQGHTLSTSQRKPRTKGSHQAEFMSGHRGPGRFRERGVGSFARYERDGSATRAHE